MGARPSQRRDSLCPGEPCPSGGAARLPVRMFGDRHIAVGSGDTVAANAFLGRLNQIVAFGWLNGPMLYRRVRGQ